VPNRKEDLIFGLVEKAAAERRRCPTNPEIAEFLRTQGFPAAFSSVPKMIGRLVKAGRMIVRVYGHNWRDITICTGHQAGKATIGPPNGGDPYILIDEAGRAKRDAQNQRARS
jgi:hypothetical protein